MTTISTPLPRNYLEISPQDKELAKQNVLSAATYCLLKSSEFLPSPTKHWASLSLHTLRIGATWAASYGRQSNIHQNSSDKNTLSDSLTHPLKQWGFTLPAFGLAAWGGYRAVVHGEIFDPGLLLPIVGAISLVPSLANLVQVGIRAVKGVSDCYRHGAADRLQALKKGLLLFGNFSAEILRLGIVAKEHLKVSKIVQSEIEDAALNTQFENEFGSDAEFIQSTLEKYNELSNQPDAIEILKKAENETGLSLIAPLGEGGYFRERRDL